MSLIYHKYQNKNEDSKAYGKWYARAVVKETANIEEVALKMQDNCTVKRADILAVLSELGPTITDMLQGSKAVRIPYLGTFKLGISSEGADSPENFNVKKNVKRVYLKARGTGIFLTQNITRGCSLGEMQEYVSPKDENQQGDIDNP